MVNLTVFEWLGSVIPLKFLDKHHDFLGPIFFIVNKPGVIGTVKQTALLLINLTTQ